MAMLASANNGGRKPGMKWHQRRGENSSSAWHAARGGAGVARGGAARRKTGSRRAGGNNEINRRINENEISAYRKPMISK
jgi:hypothetical protein